MNKKDLHDLKINFEKWENILEYSIYDSNAFSYIYKLVIKTKNNYFIAYVNGDDEMVQEKFEDIQWYEAEQKAILTWVEKDE